MRHITYAAALLAAMTIAGCSGRKASAPEDIPAVTPSLCTTVFTAGEEGYDMFANPRIIIPFYEEGNADPAYHPRKDASEHKYDQVIVLADGYKGSKRSPRTETVMKVSWDGGISWNAIEVMPEKELEAYVRDYGYVPMGSRGKTLDYLSGGKAGRWQLRMVTGRDARLEISGDGWDSATVFTSVNATQSGDFGFFYEGSIAVVSDEGEGDITLDVYNKLPLIEAVRQTPDKVVMLYPEGQDSDKGVVEDGVQVTRGPGESNGITNPEWSKLTGNIGNIGDKARLEIYLPRECTSGKMVIIMPGGGYGNLSARREGTSVAQWLNREGIAAAVLIYRMPGQHREVPLTDAHNAMLYCRAHAAGWGVKEIGVMGFSAGGHLCAYASNFWDAADGTRPDFSIPVYPVITLKGHRGTRINLVGEDEALARQYSMENCVTAETPRTMIILSADDKVVPYPGAIRYFEALKAAGVQVQLMVLPYGGHGWGWNSEEPGQFDPIREYRAAVLDGVKAFITDDK